MKCPACKSAALEHVELEPGLPGAACSACSGTFIRFEQYLAWLESQPSGPESPVGSGPSVRAPESEGAKLCPDCGRFLARFRVRSDLPFVVERCGGCSGLWLDGGEWSALREHGLHAQLNRATSEAWQHRLRIEEGRREQEDRYRALLGEEGYAKVQEFKRWLSNHPRRQVVWAYLEDKDVP